MANLALWNLVSELKSEKYKWVDLTHELSPETPHWYGFNPLEAKLLFDYVEGTPEDMMAPMRCFQVSVASQYGTHVDVPRHFWGDGRSMESIDVTEMVMPLVVVDKSKECAANPDFMLTIDDLKAWEAEYGQIPAGSFLFLQHIRCMIQDPAGFIVSLFGDQKLCLKQSGRCIPFIHSHHTFHQFAGLCQPGTCSDLT